jgi:hypothetical protein
MLHSQLRTITAKGGRRAALASCWDTTRLGENMHLKRWAWLWRRRLGTAEHALPGGIRFALIRRHQLHACALKF